MLRIWKQKYLWLLELPSPWYENCNYNIYTSGWFDISMDRSFFCINWRGSRGGYLSSALSYCNWRIRFGIRFQAAHFICSNNNGNFPSILAIFQSRVFSVYNKYLFALYLRLKAIVVICISIVAHFIASIVLLVQVANTTLCNLEAINADPYNSDAYE